MGISRIFRRRNLALLALLVLITGAVYGFAAANTVPASGAGDGVGVISGYTASGITYDLAADPTTIDSVSFSLTPNAGQPAPLTVKAKFESGAGATWFDCTLVGTTWTCPVLGTVSVLDANELRIVAAQ